jgi:hypothetical protein
VARGRCLIGQNPAQEESSASWDITAEGIAGWLLGVLGWLAKPAIVIG